MAALICVAGCGGDDDAEPLLRDGGMQGSESGSGGSRNQSGDGSGAGTSGGVQGGTSGGGEGGSGGANAGTGGRAGGGAGSGGFQAPMCTEEAPDEVVCGGETCSAPRGGFNRCVVPCCAERDGEEVCGTRSTAQGSTTECAALPATDERCPDYEFNGRTLPGCCASSGLCGIISSLSNTCITESRFVDLPENPMPCDGGEDPDPTDPEQDAGADDDAGAN